MVGVPIGRAGSLHMEAERRHIIRKRVMSHAVNIPNRVERGSLTSDRLRELLRYNPETGMFLWIVTRGKNRIGGKEAGALNNERRRVIRVDYRMYYAHRLAWLYVTGKWPERAIDHIDGDPSNNRWSNLRAATLAQNAWNMARTSRNTSGEKGVDFFKQYGKWRAQVKANGRVHFLGHFENKDEAIETVRCARARLHREFARN